MTILYTALAAEGHLKWKGKNGSLGAVSQCSPGARDWEAWTPEADNTFCKKTVLFSHGFKTDIAIFVFILGSRKVVQ